MKATRVKPVFKKKCSEKDYDTLDKVYLKVWRSGEFNSEIATDITINQNSVKNFIAIRTKMKHPATDEALRDLNKLLIYFDEQQPQTLQDCKNVLLSFRGKEAIIQEGELNKVYRQYLNERGEELAQQTLQILYTIRGMLIRWQWSIGKDIGLIEFDAEEFNEYMKNEFTVYEQHPDWFKQTDSKRPSMKRSDNGLATRHAYLRGFFKWCVKKGKLKTSPYDVYKIKEATYKQEPTYLLPEERDYLAALELANHKERLSRDLFIFCCYTSMRIGDALALTHDNIKGGMLVFIPHKTQGKEIRITINERIATIIDRWKGGATIFPSIAVNVINPTLKKIAKEAYLNRMVVIRKDEKVSHQPIWQVISTHMARRTMISTAINKGYRPEQISSVSGHKYNSKAFARYFAISQEVKDKMLDDL